MHARIPLLARTFLMPSTAAVLVGCSTADGTAKTSGAEPSSSTTATAPAEALSEAELEALVLQADDLPQARPDGIPVQERTDPADRPSFKPASDPDCQKVHDIRGGSTASAVVGQIINWKGGIYPGGATLAAYDDGKAEQLFTELEQALGSCATYQGDGWTGAYTSTVKTQKAPEVGDEALQYREYSTLEFGKRDELFIVVRTGNVIATYQSLEVGRTSNFPTAPITKQTERLRDAQSR
ncbi:hypothetical protein JIX56_13235 [Streptomyces sp. CA-210063]|uniref:hypothetical protein n=1 Tax=Streptomyces sp. CA-210063 TaxID=2801029 RepID=UPI00214C6BBE|nr:hypothetical protein [Streptomyces sp. CA-210063]UUU30793.1 hypothetical protein JIX56_13235 [Streptomyces sp. CA-210063]